MNFVRRLIPFAHKGFVARATTLITPSVREINILSLKYSGENLKGSERKEDIQDATKDRSRIIPVETSINYIQSEAYAATYGDQPVWKQYRRNHKGAIPPRKTRRTCIRNKQISTGNPCPICRDEYLVPHSKNVELLKQFISPYTGEVLSYSVTGVCQKQHKELLVAIKRAQDEGLLTYDVPFRYYDYSLYKPES